MKQILISLILFTFGFSALAQLAVGVGSVGFAGTNNDNLSLSSAFRTEISFGIIYIPIPITDSWGAALIIQPGLYWDKYCFEKNIIPKITNNKTSLEEDLNPNHNYRDRLFSYKTLMQSSNFRLPFNLYFPITKKLIGTIGGNISFMINGKFKQKFFENNKKVVNKISYNINSNPFKFNRFQYGINVSLKYKRFVLFGNYDFSSLFKRNFGPNIHLYSVGLYYNIPLVLKK